MTSLLLHGWVTDRWTDGRTSVWLRAQSRHADPRRRRRKCRQIPSSHGGRRRDVFNTLVMNSESTTRQVICLPPPHDALRRSARWLAGWLAFVHFPSASLTSPRRPPTAASRANLCRDLLRYPRHRRWCPNGVRITRWWWAKRRPFDTHSHTANKHWLMHAVVWTLSTDNAIASDETSSNNTEVIYKLTFSGSFISFSAFQRCIKR